MLIPDPARHAVQGAAAKRVALVGESLLPLARGESGDFEDVFGRVHGGMRPHSVSLSVARVSR